jgi:hypothetical protein
MRASRDNPMPAGCMVTDGCACLGGSNATSSRNPRARPPVSSPSPAKLRARHDRRGSRRHAGTRGLLGQTFARRDGNRLRVQAGLPLRNSPNAGREIVTATFACVAIATGMEQYQTGFKHQITLRPTGRANGETRAQLSDFAINKWQTAPSPLHWGKVFASGERVSGAGVSAIRQDR